MFSHVWRVTTTLSKREREIESRHDHGNDVIHRCWLYSDDASGSAAVRWASSVNSLNTIHTNRERRIRPLRHFG